LTIALRRIAEALAHTQGLAQIHIVPSLFLCYLQTII
jgi:hypothetical protein